MSFGMGTLKRGNRLKEQLPELRTSLISTLFLKIPMSSILDTAEYRKLALIAAGVPLGNIPPIIDTATWRKMMIAALLQNTANQAIAGRVDYYGQLPVTTGSPAIGTTFLVLNSSGIYYVNYRSAGIYVKLTDTGSLSDWVYAPLSAIGTLPDVTLTNQQVGDTLTWNGTRWVNSPTSSPLLNVRETDQTILINGNITNIASLSVAANTKYLIEAHYIVLSIGIGGGPNGNILCPEGTTGGASFPYIDSTASAGNSGTYYGANTPWLTTPSSPAGTYVQIGRTNCRGAGSLKGFIKTGSNSGTVTMQIRGYSTSNTGTVFAGSFLKLEKYS